MFTNLPYEFTVFARYALIAVGVWLANNGVSVPEELEFAFTDPEMIQLVAGIAFDLVALVWYKFSEAREALLEKIAEKKAASA